MRTPLGQAQGLGSAKEGVGHWWAQRLTSVALIPLVLWLAFSLACLPGMSYIEFRGWLNSPITATLLVLFLIALFYHLQLGLQVILEDYVHSGWLKLLSLVLVNFTCWLLGVAAVLSVIKLYLG
jgi:succinate dehydrogenase / fumarate reductase, membrane anchor subunit